MRFATKSETESKSENATDPAGRFTSTKDAMKNAIQRPPLPGVLYMFARFCFISVLTLLILIGCSGKNKSAFTPFVAAPIEKGTPSEPQLATIEDQEIVAFNELGWSRQIMALAINPPRLSAQEGCVLRRPVVSGSRFLVDSYDCKRLSDSEDKLANRLFQLSGSMFYKFENGFYDAEGSLLAGTYLTSAANPSAPTQLLAQGSISRKVQIMAPKSEPVTDSVAGLAADLKGSTYRFASSTRYRGAVAA